MCNSLKVDQKGRLKIPMALVAALKGSGSEFYITSENGSAVRIYPMKVWNEINAQLERLALHDMNCRKLLVRVKYFGQAVTIDKQWRLLIPIVLRNSAQMEGTVDVLDYANYLEVWNHARLMDKLNSNPIVEESETKLSELIPVRPSARTANRKKRQRHANERERRFVLHGRLHGDSRGQMSHGIRGARTDQTERARVA